MVGSIDDVTWQVLTVALTVMGLVASGLLWRLRGPASGLRGVAWSLLPVAALLTGTWRLIWEIGDSVISWALRFVFSPVVWLGIIVAAVSGLMFVVASAMRRRGLGARGRGATSRKRDKAMRVSRSTARAEDPALRSAAGSPVAKASVDDDMAEVEAILKQRGIS